LGCVSLAEYVAIYATTLTSSMRNIILALACV
jgi:hypothetical protein